MHGATVEKIH